MISDQVKNCLYILDKKNFSKKIETTCVSRKLFLVLAGNPGRGFLVFL
ncbi:Uncharacterized protein dnl_23620 [Desulfonema limicola]|uniref:Uncharacterized protein n=1 Tax=Desulfonema limicola TaxID=45656 RepID=A0A975B761_9BACT|nr:Uncharacterized protein dnl_23620 [Desulfonema limicola]